MAALVALTLAIYAPVRHHDFLNYDDPDYVTANGHVLQGLSATGARWAATTLEPHNWHPVTWLSHMLDVEVFGLRAGRHLLENAVIHSLNAALLFLLLWRTTRRFWKSALVAALFAVHPLHVESVAWIAERKDVLSTFFALLATHAYVSWVGHRRASSYALALALFALACMSKPMVVSLPAVLVLLDYWPLRRFDSPGTGRRLTQLVCEKLPFVAIAAVTALVTVAAQRSPAIATLGAVPLATRVANAAVAYAWYVSTTFWPARLAVFYPYPSSLSGLRTSIAILALGVLSIVAIRQRRRRPYILVGWIWFLGTLLPVIGLVQVGAQAMADRYSYLPLVGLFVIVAWGLSDLAKAIPHRRRFVFVFAAAAVVACTVVTRLQLRHWQSSETLFRHALSVTTDNFIAHNNLGEALMASGRTQEARQHFAESVRIQPRYAVARNNLAAVLALAGDVAGAAAQYADAVALAPEDADIRSNLGLLLYRKGDLAAAIAEFRAATALQPGNAKAENNLAAALEKQGSVAEALQHYRRAVDLDPSYERARQNVVRLTSPSIGSDAQDPARRVLR